MWCAHTKKHKNMVESKVEASPKQAVMDKYLRSSKMSSQFLKNNSKKILLAWLRFVHSGLPLFSFSGPSFKSTLGAIASTLRVSLHRDNIRQLIINEATKSEWTKEHFGREIGFYQSRQLHSPQPQLLRRKRSIWNGFVDSSSSFMRRFLLYIDLRSGLGVDRSANE